MRGGVTWLTWPYSWWPAWKIRDMRNVSTQGLVTFQMLHSPEKGCLSCAALQICSIWWPYECCLWRNNSVTWPDLKKILSGLKGRPVMSSFSSPSQTAQDESPARFNTHTGEGLIQVAPSQRQIAPIHKKQRRNGLSVVCSQIRPQVNCLKVRA